MSVSTSLAAACGIDAVGRGEKQEENHFTLAKQGLVLWAGAEKEERSGSSPVNLPLSLTPYVHPLYLPLSCQVERTSPYYSTGTT